MDVIFIDERFTKKNCPGCRLLRQNPYTKKPVRLCHKLAPIYWLMPGIVIDGYDTGNIDCPVKTRDDITDEHIKAAAQAYFHDLRVEIRSTEKEIERQTEKLNRLLAAVGEKNDSSR